MGYIGPVCVILFFVISTVFNKFLMSPVVALVFLQEQLEGDFRSVNQSNLFIYGRSTKMATNTAIVVCAAYKVEYNSNDTWILKK